MFLFTRKINHFLQLPEYDRYIFNVRRQLFRTKFMHQMDPFKAVITYVESSPSVGISFRYINQPRNVDRMLNMNRPVDEPISSLVLRISCNVQKLLDKKVKRKAAKLDELDSPNADSSGCEVSVAVIKISADNDDKNSLNPVVLNDQTCHEILVKFGSDHVIAVGDQQYILDVNPPRVITLSLPKNIMSGFMIYPKKMELIDARREDSDFVWFKSQVQFETEELAKHNMNRMQWLPAGNGFSVETSVDDIGRLLKLLVTPGLGDRKGALAEVVSSSLVSAGPGICPFENRHKFTKEVLGNNGVRVVGYNILADLYSDSDHARQNLFPTCPPYALDMDYRKQLLLKEIIGYNADIICLEEVDDKVFLRDLQPAFACWGLDGIFGCKGGQTAEGSALFYRQSKLKLIEQCQFVLSEELQNNTLFNDLRERLQAFQSTLQKLNQRQTSLQVAVLQSVQHPNQVIVVGITHLYFHPNADNIRIIQASVCLELLRQIVGQNKLKFAGCDVSLLFCGDFNSTPTCEVFQLITAQIVNFDEVKWCPETEECLRGFSLSHDLEMESACGYPLYTNYTTGFQGCLDYIFYQPDHFAISQVIPMLSHDEVTQHVALPSVTIPSDHLALVVDLIFKGIAKEAQL